MEHERKIQSLLFLSCFLFTAIQAQETIPATGGSATGSGGTVTYSVGQVTYNTFSATTGTVAQGVQQPYEISVVTGISDAREITLECTIFLNPTTKFVKLMVEAFDYENLRFRLYDVNGILIQDKKVESRVTEISMENLSSSIYFLKVINNNTEVKVFKIVKN